MTDDDWKRAVDCAASQLESYARQDQLATPEQRRAALDDVMQHAFGLLTVSSNINAAELLNAIPGGPGYEGRVEQAVGNVLTAYRLAEGRIAARLRDEKRYLLELAALRPVVVDMLSGLEYLRTTNRVPYGFGIDRLEQTGKAALDPHAAASEAKAAQLYERHTDNHPTIHSNRFPSWSELTDEQKREWRERVLNIHMGAP